MNNLLETPRNVTPEGSHPERWPMRQFAFFAGVLLLLALVLQPTSFGQGITGSITGTVTDSTGAAITGATVTVTQIATNSVHMATTSDVGNFTVIQLAPGEYTVKIEKGTFKSYQQKGVVLSIDQIVQINAQLSVGAKEETVEVTSASPVIQTEDSSVGSVIDQPGDPEHAAERTVGTDGSYRPCARSPGCWSPGPVGDPRCDGGDRYGLPQCIWQPRLDA